MEGEDGTSAADAAQRDANGEVTIELPTGECTVGVQADGYAETEEQISIADSSADLLVELEKTTGEDSTSGGPDNDTGTGPHGSDHDDGGSPDAPDDGTA
ncbi:MAG: hypothetical protein ACQET5_06550 [Halobacteriota archaeon]|uniref:hypothetical protein n=1 Tax=Natronomonas sp. TaxID=2184060 RepID=UPI003976F62D